MCRCSRDHGNYHRIKWCEWRKSRRQCFADSLYGTDGFGYPFAGLAITMTAIIVTLIILALEIFVGSLLEVGGKRFFVLNKTENPTVGTIFDAFRSGNYVNVVLAMFLKICLHLCGRCFSLFREL